MGKVEERCRVDRIELCEESLVWFEGMPVVVGDEPMAAGFFPFFLDFFHVRLYTLFIKLYKNY